MSASEIGRRAPGAVAVLVLSLLVALLGTALAKKKAPPPVFKPVKGYGVGYDPLGVATGDFDQDGKADLVTANFDATTGTAYGYSVLRGTGGGRFAPAVSTVLPEQVPDVAVATLPGDSDPDLILSSFSSGSLLILHGAAGATFGPPQPIVLSPGPVRDFTVDDFNGDKVPDLAAIRENAGTIAVLFGKPDGSYLPPLDITPPARAGTWPAAIRSARLDKGRRADLVVGRSDGLVLTYIALRGNKFAAPKGRAGDSLLLDLATGDFDGDRKTDVAGVVAIESTSPLRAARGINVAEDRVIVMRGRGNGKLRKPYRRKLGSTPHLAESIAAGDLNGDGRDDIVAGYERLPQVAMLRGRKKGKLTGPAFIGTTASPRDLVVASLNRDKRLDVAASGERDDNTGGLDVLIQKKPRKKKK